MGVSNTQVGPKRRAYHGRERTEASAIKKVETKEKIHADSGKKKSEYSSSVDAEMGLKSLKCYKCHEKGHIARLCPESRMISLERAIDALLTPFHGSGF